MKPKKVFLKLFLLSSIFLSACSSQITGNWTVDKYATLMPGTEQQGVTLSNIGTMMFKGNGAGEKELGYNVLGITKNDTLPFQWKLVDEYITIKGEETELAKSWIIIKSSRTEQVWKSTDGANEVQVLQLKKKKE